jgi:hypothetical protein
MPLRSDDPKFDRELIGLGIESSSGTVQLKRTRGTLNVTRCPAVRQDRDRSLDGSACPPFSDKVRRNCRLRRIMGKRRQLQSGQDCQNESKGRQHSNRAAPEAAPKPGESSLLSRVRRIRYPTHRMKYAGFGPVFETEMRRNERSARCFCLLNHFADSLHRESCAFG